MFALRQNVGEKSKFWYHTQEIVNGGNGYPCSSFFQKAEAIKGTEKQQALASTPLSDNEIDHQDMEQSIALLETILSPEIVSRYKTQDSKL